MKILFLCGSMEPGHDGVGDYTRNLAGELLNQNHQACIIALNDFFLKEEILENVQQSERQNIPTLRLSNILSWHNKIKRSIEFIKLFDPDWISLQFVPFSFQSKGLPFGLARIIKKISKEKKLHIMFHELWVGMSIQSSWRHVLWGSIQRSLIQSLVHRLKPNVIHTQTELYQIYLTRLSIESSLLPLFSNIPVKTSTDNFLKKPFFAENHSLSFVFFGGIFPGAPVTQLAKEVATYANKKKVNIELVIIGRNGTQQDIWASAWDDQGLPVRMLGEQSPTYISEILSQSSIGISTTPVALSGKSGSIVAMLSHGLPVLCVSEPWQPRQVNFLATPSGILEYNVGNFELCLDTNIESFPQAATVKSVANQFIFDLLAN